MVEGITKRELQKRVGNARLRPENNSRDARIHKALQHIMDDGKVFYVLADIPEQFEDVLRILVDDRKVVAFELKRNDPKALPEAVEQYSVEEYRKAIGEGLPGAKLRFALELARRDLGR